MAGASASAYDYCNANSTVCSDFSGMIPSWVKNTAKGAVTWVVKVAVAAAVTAFEPEFEPWAPSIANCVAAIVGVVLFSSGSWKTKLLESIADCIVAFLGSSPASKKIEKYVGTKATSAVTKWRHWIWEATHCWGWC